ncbi:MAG: hypothetical protein NVSMB3_03240 [Acidobacteriaceae bacterium]
MRLTEVHRRLRAALAAGMFALALIGCASHRRVQPFVLPPFTPVELAQAPAMAEPPMIEADDDGEDLPPVPVAEGAAEPRRQRRRAVKAPTLTPPPEPPPEQVAEAITPAESASVIGEFTPGGDQDPKTQKEATDLIAANEKRLNGLSAEVVRGQTTLVNSVRNFQKQAQQALKAGDAAGAKTLATKGKLLLDDLEKAAGA